MIRRRRYEISILADKIVEGSRLLRARAFLHVCTTSRRFQLVAACWIRLSNLRDASTDERFQRKTIFLRLAILFSSAFRNEMYEIERKHAFYF